MHEARFRTTVRRTETHCYSRLSIYSLGLSMSSEIAKPLEHSIQLSAWQRRRAPSLPNYGITFRSLAKRVAKIVPSLGWKNSLPNKGSRFPRMLPGQDGRGNQKSSPAMFKLIARGGGGFLLGSHLPPSGNSNFK